MDKATALRCLEATWRSYLEEKGHHIYQNNRIPALIRTRDGDRNRFRWLLLVAERPCRILTGEELRNIHTHMRHAQVKNEYVYLVVGFDRDPRRIIAVPAKTVLKTGHIFSDRGGIAWND